MAITGYPVVVDETVLKYTKVLEGSSFQRLTSQLDDGEFLVVSGFGAYSAIIENKKHHAGVMSTLKEKFTLKRDEIDILAIKENDLFLVIPGLHAGQNLFEFSNFLGQLKKEGKFAYVKTSEGGQERSRR